MDFHDFKISILEHVLALVGVAAILWTATRWTRQRIEDYRKQGSVRIACVIAAEAAGEGREGWLAIANVIQNRASVFGSDPVNIITERGQFKRISVEKAIRLSGKNWFEILDIASRCSRFGIHRDNTDGARFFYSGEAPSWKMTSLHFTTKIGNHYFYR